jgi:hypothetical protein
MMVSRFVFAVTILLAASSACRSSKTIDVMMMPAVCDSTQAQPDPTEPGPQLPSLSSSTNRATLIGTIEEAVSRHPLRSGTIALTPMDSASSGSAVKSNVPSDQFGGFALDSLLPGEYVITARRIGYQPIEQRITLAVGRVDTVRFIMRRYSCVGY